jgi:xylulokinase
LRQQVEIHEITVIGGGAKGDVWRQIMADVYNTRILVPSLLEEAGSMGAAVTGGVGAGIYKDFTAVERFLEINSVQEPDQAAVEKYRQVKAVFDECYFALKDVFPKLNV